MSALSIEIQSEDVFKALERAPEIVSAELRKGLKDVLYAVATDARNNHRFSSKSGGVERSVQVKVEDSGLSGKVFLNTGVTEYAGYVHDGTRPHKIAPKTRKSLFWVSSGNKHFSKLVNHPGTKPDKFLNAALERNRGFILKKIGETISVALKKSGFKK